MDGAEWTQNTFPGSSQPPPYTISGSRSPGPMNPSCPPPKSPIPNRRPIEAFGEFPNAPYGGTYPNNQIPPPGQMYFGQQQPQVHTMGGPYGYGYHQPTQPYNGQQRFGAPGQPPYYPAYAMPQQQPQQQQQQQSVVIVGGGTQHCHQPVVYVQSFSSQICLACFVFWCCGGIFGAVAFVLAAIASSQARQDPQSARHLGRASLWVSVAGIIVTVVIASIVFGVVFSRPRTYSSSSSRSNSYYYY